MGSNQVDLGGIICPAAATDITWPIAGGCVIVGRAADFVLADRPRVLRVFLRASPEARIARVPELRALPPDRARRALRTADRRRAAFYNYFTDRKWGDAATYDLCLDISALSPE